MGGLCAGLFTMGSVIVYNYARGMSTYVSNNHCGDNTEEIEKLETARVETSEKWAWLLENSDATHTDSCIVMISMYDKKQLSQLMPWYWNFWQAPVCASKLACQQFQTGCVQSARHHGLDKPDHICSI